MRKAMLVAACVVLCAALAAAADTPGSEVPDEVDERVMLGSDLTLKELLAAGGGFSYVMVVLAVAMVAAGIYCSLECRRGRVLPETERAAVMQGLVTGDRARALEALEGKSSFFARGVRAALSRTDAAPGEACDFLRASGERDAAALRGRLAALARLAAISALVGLLGTLVGMHQAFGVAAMEVYRPLHAYAAVFKGLVVSVFAVGLATVAIAVYFVLVGRLERALADAGFAFEEVAALLGRARPGPEGGTWDVRPPSGPVPGRDKEAEA